VIDGLANFDVLHRVYVWPPHSRKVRSACKPGRFTFGTGPGSHIVHHHSLLRPDAK